MIAQKERNVYSRIPPIPAQENGVRENGEFFFNKFRYLYFAKKKHMIILIYTSKSGLVIPFQKKKRRFLAIVMRIVQKERNVFAHGVLLEFRK